MVAHTCNPRTLGGQGGKIAWAQEFKTSLGKNSETASQKKKKKTATRPNTHTCNSSIGAMVHLAFCSRFFVSIHFSCCTIILMRVILQLHDSSLYRLVAVNLGPGAGQVMVSNCSFDLSPQELCFYVFHTIIVLLSHIGGFRKDFI